MRLPHGRQISCVACSAPNAPRIRPAAVASRRSPRAAGRHGRRSLVSVFLPTESAGSHTSPRDANCLRRALLMRNFRPITRFISDKTHSPWLGRGEPRGMCMDGRRRALTRVPSSLPTAPVSVWYRRRSSPGADRKLVLAGLQMNPRQGMW